MCAALNLESIKTLIGKKGIGSELASRVFPRKTHSIVKMTIQVSSMELAVCCHVYAVITFGNMGSKILLLTFQ